MSTSESDTTTALQQSPSIVRQILLVIKTSEKQNISSSSLGHAKCRHNLFFLRTSHNTLCDIHALNVIRAGLLAGKNNLLAGLRAGNSLFLFKF